MANGKIKVWRHYFDMTAYTRAMPGRTILVNGGRGMTRHRESSLRWNFNRLV